MVSPFEEYITRTFGGAFNPFSPAPATPAPQPVLPMRTPQPLPQPVAKKVQPPPPPMQYQDPSDVHSRAVDEIRHTYEYVEMVNAGLSDQEAVIAVMYNALKGQGMSASKPITASGVVQGLADAGQGALDTSAAALGIPQASDTPNVDVTLGPPKKPEVRVPILTPQEDQQQNQAAMNADNWERILKPQYQEKYPEEDLNAQITAAQSELQALENQSAASYGQSVTGAGEGDATISGDSASAQDQLDMAIEAKKTEINELTVMRGVLYGEPQPDQPWYQGVVNTIMKGADYLHVGDYLHALDEPSKVMRQNVGGYLIRLQANGQLQPGMTLAAGFASGPAALITNAMGQSLSQDEVNQAYAQGGDAAVWELAVQRYAEINGLSPAETAIIRGIADAGYDPLNVMGELSTATRGIPVVGRVLGPAIEGVNLAANLPGDAAVAIGTKGAKTIAKAPGIAGLLEPGATAISRSTGMQAEDLATRLEQGIPSQSVGIPSEGGSTILPDRGGPPRPASPAPRVIPPEELPYVETPDVPRAPRPDPLTGVSSIENVGSPPSIGSRVEDAAVEPQDVLYLDGTPLSEPDLAVYQAMTDAGERPEDVIRYLSEKDGRVRPVYADETPFTDADYQEYRTRVAAGEEPRDVVESIYMRGEGGTPPVEPTPPTPGRATKTNPLGDLLGEEPRTTITPNRVPERTNPAVVEKPAAPRPRYFDGTSFNDEDYARYVVELENGADPDELIQGISSDRLTTTQESGRPSVANPGIVERTPTVDAAPTRDVTPSESSPDRGGNRAVDRYPDDPELIDIPRELRNSESPELENYGMKRYINGREVPAGSRIKGGKFGGGQKGWRQLVRSIELDVQDGVFSNPIKSLSGRSWPDHDTAELIRYAVGVDDDKKAEGVFRFLENRGNQSYVDGGGNRFRLKGKFDESGIAKAVDQDGKRAVVIKKPEGGYTAGLVGQEPRDVTVRSIGGMGTPDDAPYVPELIDRLRKAREDRKLLEGTIDTSSTPVSPGRSWDDIDADYERGWRSSASIEGNENIAMRYAPPVKTPRGNRFRYAGNDQMGEVPLIESPDGSRALAVDEVNGQWMVTGLTDQGAVTGAIDDNLMFPTRDAALDYADQAVSKAPRTPSSRTSGFTVEWGDPSLGIRPAGSDLVDKYIADFNGYRERVRTGRKTPDKVTPIDTGIVESGSLANDLHRFGVLDTEEKAWLNTPNHPTNIRIRNLTANERKVVAEVMGLPKEAGASEKALQGAIDTGIESGALTRTMPTRGEVFESIMAAIPDYEPHQRLEIWKKMIGGVEPPKSKLGRGWAEMSAMVRSAILHNWVKLIPNTLQDMGTNHFVMMVDGQPGVSELHLQLMKDFLKNNKGLGEKLADPLNNFDPNGATALLESFYDGLGIPVPASVKSTFGGRWDEELGRLIENSETWWSNAGKKVGGSTGERLGGVVAGKTAKEIRSAQDDLMRWAASADFIMRNYNSAYTGFMDEVAQAFPTIERSTLERRLRGVSHDLYGMPVFDPHDVAIAFRPFNQGRDQAEHLARRWRGYVGGLNKGGVENVSRTLFTFLPTKIDEKIGKLWMFHYWMTRASVQHARLALEHPQLMVQYMRAWEGSKRMADAQGESVPRWARQFISLNVGPYGMLGFISPAALLTGLGTVMDINGVLDDPSAYNLLATLPFHPIVQAAASVYLTERLPDPTGTNNTRQFARAAINFLRNEMGVGSPGLTSDPLAGLTYKIQELARKIAPGAQPLSAPAPQEKDTQQVKYYAATIMQNTPNPDGGGTLWMDENGAVTDYANQVMANIDAGLYSGDIEQQALDQWSADTLGGRTAAGIVPIQGTYPSVVGEARAENRSGADAQYADPKLDTTTAPSEGGIETESFIDTSREPTTSELAGSTTVDVADAGGAQAGTLFGQLTQYQNLGSKDDQELHTAYNNFIYWTGDQLQAQYGGEGIIINGEHIPYAIWNQLSADTRRIYMDSWTKEIGRDDDLARYRDARDQYESSHPLVGQFKRWQEAVGKDPQAFLAAILDPKTGSPSFQAWWATQNVKPAYVQKVLMTPDAFLSAIGQQGNLYESNDISSKPIAGQQTFLDQYAPQGDTSNQGSSTPFEALSAPEKVIRINQKLEEYVVKMKEFDQQIAPITGGVPYANLGPSGLQILGKIMQSEGITMPQVPSIVQDYMDWAGRQPQNADTSVSAYVDAAFGDAPTTAAA